VREREHFLQLGLVVLHIHILCPVLVGRPGLIGIGSTRLSVDNDFIRHITPPSWIAYTVHNTRVRAFNQGLTQSASGGGSTVTPSSCVAPSARPVCPTR
jgi:hypothetical protein